MSSPLSNLKKGKKVPLPFGSKHPGNGVPFRSSPQYSADESRLLDEITGGMTSHRGQNSRLSNITPIGDNVKTPDDFQLMSSMMTRISQLEHQVQHQAKDILAKDKKIKILEDKLKILNQATVPKSTSHTQELEKKCLLLQQHVHEMETFLADYGMMWVGHKQDPDSDVYHGESTEEEDMEEETEASGRASMLDHHGSWNPASSVAEFQMNFDLVIENIAELNALAGDGISKIQHTIDGARLKMPDAIKLTLYGNGILLFSGPFRPYTDPSTQSCMKDIMDGYFPSELQDRYPDGVPIQVTDKRQVHFKDRLEGIFEGSAQQLGGETKPSRLVPSTLNKGHQTTDGMPVESTTPGQKLTMDQFLSKMPKSVIKGGKVVNIRETIGETLKGNEAGRPALTVVDTPAAQELVNRMDTVEKSRPPSSRDITTLRVKSTKGDNTYILKMKFTDTLGDVRRCLDKQRGVTIGQYDIVSAFPQSTYTDDKMTLKQYGLVPNATLHLKPKK